MGLNEFRKDISAKANPEKARILQRFFKTGKGEYGEGDVFLGITVPKSREIAIKFKDLSLQDVEFLLQSSFHEERLIALLLLVHNYNLAKKEKNEKKKEEIYSFYLNNRKYINNWDLVDLSAHQIIGHYLEDKNRLVLYRLAKSDNIWERRIAVIATFYFIKNNQFNDSLKISLLLLKDNHDLIQKAVGWMLREVGKKDSDVLENFLKKNYKNMPRTMLRYAIERFPEDKRKKYLRGEM